MLAIATRRCLQASLSRRCAAAAVTGARAQLCPVAFVQQPRGFASAAAGKAAKALEAEIKHEEEQYEQAKEVKAFLKKSDFKLADTEGDVNLALERTLDSKVVRIEWQLSSPFSPEDDMEGELQVEEATDFSVTIEAEGGGAGIAFYCSTQTGEDHRYVIGNVKAFETAAERDSVSSYNGPDFEDVDEKLQEAFDEYLAEVGMSNDVCDFIDGLAQDKEQREYVRWLKVAQKFLAA